MTTDNGGTKNNQGLLRFQSGLGIYCSNIYLDLVICSLVSCSHHAVVSLGLVLCFLQKTTSSYRATSPERKQTLILKSMNWIKGEVIPMFGCVWMAHLYVPSHDRCRNVIRSASVQNRTT